MSAVNGLTARESFLRSGWIKALGGFVGLVLLLAVMAYVNSSRVIALVDDHFYEETLSACVVVFGWVASDRLTVELQTYCNVSMFTLAAQNQQRSAGTEK